MITLKRMSTRSATLVFLPLLRMYPNSALTTSKERSSQARASSVVYVVLSIAASVDARFFNT